ncbi:MAG: pre-peptidase C-terminal domain-containing protein [Cyanobacteria bacterium P01_E01_bin.6]
MARDGVKNFLRRARRANPGTGRFRFSDAIGGGDNDDLYRIRLTNKSSLNLKVSRLRADVDVELYTFDQPRSDVIKEIGRTPFSDLRRRSIRQLLNLEASESGARRIRMTEDLEANDYYLRITPGKRNAETNYRVVLRATEIADSNTGSGGSGGGDTGSGGGDTGSGGGDTGSGGGGTEPTIPADGNNSRATAQLLTVDFKQRTYDNNNLPSGFTEQTFFLGGDDNEDYFKFELQTASTVNLNLTGLNGAALSADLDVQIQDSLGIQKAISNGFGSSNEAISDQVLPADTYFIRVFKTPGLGESNYALTVSALPEDIDPNGAGETAATAAELDLSTLTNGKTFNDFVGGADTNDYYKVVIPAGGGFIGIDVDEIEDDDIDGRTSNLDLQIIPATSLDGNGDLIPSAPVTTSARDGANKEEVAGIFEEGTYFIRVYPSTTDDGAFYRMNLQAFSILDVPAIVNDINPGTPSSLTGTTLVGDPSANSGNGILYFFANDGTGDALWQSEGTLATTVKIGAPTDASSFNNLINVNGDIFFTATATGTGTELYVYDGNNISLVQDINPNANASGIVGSSQFLVADGKLYFTANDGTTGTELWVTEGTAATTARVTDIATGSGLSNNADPNQLTYAESGGNKVLYFIASDSAGDSVYQYNIVSEAVSKIGTGILANDSLPDNLTLANDNLYFNADSTSFSNDLWVIANAASSTTVTSVTTSSAFGTSNPGYGEFTAFDGTLYFVASDDQNTRGIWRVNSTNNAVEQVAELGGVDSLAPEQLTVLTSGSTETLYFIGNTTSDGQQLWGISDANATAASGSINLSLGSSTGSYEVTSDLRNVDNLTVVGSGTPTLYFTAAQLDGVGDDITGNELFKVDGVLSGISSPFANIRPDDLTAVDSNNDPAPIIRGSNPSNLVEVGGRLFFVANNNSEDADGNAIGAGEELWVLGIEV